MRNGVLLILFIFTGFLLKAQTKKDGSPDMRYSANKSAYSGSYSAPTRSSSSYPTVKYQNAYIKSDGTYVQGHMKTNINSTNTDNFTTTSNYNIYNNTTGSKPKDYTLESQRYSSDKIVIQGSNGGQYYNNSKGTKTYVPKIW